MRTLALVLALLVGCGTMREHPFSTIAVANSTIVASAGTCAIECHGTARGVSEGVLLSELAVSGTLAMWFGAWLVYYATGDQR